MINDNATAPIEVYEEDNKSNSWGGVTCEQLIKNINDYFKMIREADNNSLE